MSCEVEEAQTCSTKRTFSIRALLAITGIWAVLFCIQSWQSMIVLSVILLTWLFGCNRTRKAVYLIVPALYQPVILLVVLWPFLNSGFPSDYFLNFGLVPGIHFSTSKLWAVGITATVLLLTVTTIRFFPKATDAAIVVAIVISLLSSVSQFVFISTSGR